MITQIKKWGTSHIITLDPVFLKFKSLKEGDWVDISEVTKVLPTAEQLVEEVKNGN